MFFLFPQVKDKASFLSDFLLNVLPEIKPHIFPHSENASWLHNPEYELSSVTKRQEKVQEVASVAQTRIEQLQAEIEIEREQNDYLYRLTYETGDALKDAGKRGFVKNWLHSSDGRR